MSKYFQTLKRLQARVATPDRATTPEIAVAEQGQAEQVFVFPGINLQSPKVQSVYSKLLAGLRLAAQADPAHCVVVAGVSGPHASRHIIAGLEDVAVQNGLAAVVGELGLASGALNLRAAGSRHNDVRSVEHQDPELAPRLDLASPSLNDLLRQRIERTHSQAVLSLVHGPPVAEAVDAALFASACSGIVLVVEPLVTPRADLVLALSRLKQPGCQILGVVTVGASSRLPGWIRRSFDSSAS